MNNSAPDRHAYHIAALAKGLAVLTAFNPDRVELGLKDIAAAAGVTQPSALRIAHTLAEADFLVRNPATKGYRLGPNAVSVGLATLGAMTLPEICEPYLVELRDQTDAMVKLAVPTGTAAVIVGRALSYRGNNHGDYIGTRIALHIGSLGRAILAWMPEERVRAYMAEARFVALTPRTLTREQVETELAATRRRGYSLNDRGVSQENRSVGAPLLDPSGVAIGAINVSTPAHRATLERLRGELAPLVVSAAKRISRSLPPHVQGAGRADGFWNDDHAPIVAPG